MGRTNLIRFLLLATALSLIHEGCASRSFQVKLEPKSEDCFYKDLKAGTSVTFVWNVLDGGLLDVDVRVFQSRVKIFSKLYFEGRDEGRFTFVASAEAPYGFCLNNEMSRFTVKTVSFSIETSADSPAPSDAPNADTELVPIQSSLNRIKGGLHTIEQEQSYYRVREHVHRNTAESTNTRVYAWSLVETAILLLMSVGQILYLRRLFNNEHRSGFGRV